MKIGDLALVLKADHVQHTLIGLVNILCVLEHSKNFIFSVHLNRYID